jgi:hypothetical protein
MVDGTKYRNKGLPAIGFITRELRVFTEKIFGTTPIVGVKAK